ncbi:MAG TPA: polyketide antibiotic transporter [Naasia sp.]
MATLLLATVADLLFGAAAALGLLAGGLPASGSLLTGLSAAAVGVAFAGIAALAAQVLPTSRGANGAAAALVGSAYVLRGVGDALGVPSADLLSATSAWPSWLSPIGWGQQVRPFTDADPVPLLLCLGLGATTAAVALAARRRRDLGDSLVPERTGGESGGWSSRSSLGLAVRLHRGALLGWALGGAVLGALAGLIAPAIAEALDGNSGLQAILDRLAPGTTGDPVDIFATAIFGMAGFLAAAAGCQAVMRLRSDEADGRAEAVLATPLVRLRWLGSHLAVGAASVLVVLLSAGVAGGAAFVAGGSDTGRFGTSLGAALAHAPAALVFVAVTGLLFAVLPRWTVPLGWGILALGLVLGQFGDLLRIPAGLQDLSPFSHSSGLPAESLDVAAVLILLAVALAGAALAALAFRRRDLAA